MDRRYAAILAENQFIQIIQINMAKKSSNPDAPSLVIVESPAKARTIGKFLGRGYTIEASIGHIRDLPNGAKEVPEELKKEDWAYLGVNVNHGSSRFT